MVSCTDGNGKRGKDPWKLYSPGLFQLDSTRVTVAQSLVAVEIDCPFSRDSYIHPLYISSSFSVYRIEKHIQSHMIKPVILQDTSCQKAVSLEEK